MCWISEKFNLSYNYTIITDSARNETTLVPRMFTIPSDYPFQFKRIQLPVKVYIVAMTINKSKG